LREAGLHEGHELLRAGAALATDPEGDHRRMIDQPRGRALRALLAHADLERPGLREGQGAFREPGCDAVEPHGSTAEKRCGERLHMLGIGKTPAGRRLVKGDIKAHLARGRDRRDHAERLADAPRERVGAMVAPQQRHHGAAVLSYRHDGRLAPLVLEHRCQRPHEHARRSEPDDRDAVREECPKMSARIRESDVHAAHPAGESVEARARKRRRDFVCGRQSTLAKKHDGDLAFHRQALPRRWTRIMEK